MAKKQSRQTAARKSRRGPTRGKASSTRKKGKGTLTIKRRGRRRSSRKRAFRSGVRREFPTNILYAAGWIFVPMFILPVEWKCLSPVARTVGLIWTIFYLWWMITRVYWPQG